MSMGVELGRVQGASQLGISSGGSKRSPVMPRVARLRALVAELDADLFPADHGELMAWSAGYTVSETTYRAVLVGRDGQCSSGEGDALETAPGSSGGISHISRIDISARRLSW